MTVILVDRIELFVCNRCFSPLTKFAENEENLSLFGVLLADPSKSTAFPVVIGQGWCPKCRRWEADIAVFKIPYYTEHPSCPYPFTDPYLMATEPATKSGRALDVGIKRHKESSDSAPPVLHGRKITPRRKRNGQHTK